jgi:hypothetical protein
MDELISSADSSEVPIKVFVGDNLGSRTLLFKLPMFEFFSRSQVANDRSADEHTQRKLDPNHARKLAIYVLRGFVMTAIRRREQKKEPVPAAFRQVLKMLGEQPYISLQPIVANLRSTTRDGGSMRGRPRQDKSDETICFEFFFGQKDLLWIVDGQHRRWAMELVFQFIKDVRLYAKYPKKALFTTGATDVTDAEMEVWNECAQVSRQATVAIELHLGLNVEEERQLFHDLNNLGKRVEASLSFDFDNSNPVNAFIKDVLIAGNFVEVVEKDVVNWAQDTGALARKDVVAVNAHLFLNKSNVSGAVPPKVEPKKDVALRFWQAVQAIPGFGEQGAKTKTVAAQPVVLKALAKLTYDFAWGKWSDQPELLDALLDGISDVDFSHDNPMWRYYEMDDKERKRNKLTDLGDYLPTTTGNRDIGQFQNGVMRFGAKHNDIFPIIGDMIRWTLKLPSRHEDASAFAAIPQATV